jgi:hypothetical protein
MKALLFSILLFIILIIIIKKFNFKESFETDHKNMLNHVIKFIDNSIKTRQNAGKTSKFSEDKFQNQILGLKNALKYATYIQNNII